MEDFEEGGSDVEEEEQEGDTSNNDKSKEDRGDNIEEGTPNDNEVDNTNTDH